jgi:protein-S-isoprenylcysteine O-methyltransferase Ste14
MTASEFMLLALAWLLYFVIHSILASLLVKTWVARHWSGFLPWYRLVFNALASILILVPLYLTFTASGEPVWAWRGGWFYLANGIALVAVLGFFLSLRFYDGSEFIGLRQLRNREHRVEDQETFQLSPLHYYVRHPWYFLGLIMIWTRDMPPAMLLTAIFATLYFVVGTYLEERKLIVYYGDVYRQYQLRVPALIPLPWHHLDRASAERLISQARRSRVQRMGGGPQG